MGSNTSSSSTSSSSTNNSDCYLHKKMLRQQGFQSNSNQEYKNFPQTKLGCDYQGNVVECDENGRVFRVIKPNF